MQRVVHILVKLATLLVRSVEETYYHEGHHEQDAAEPTHAGVLRMTAVGGARCEVGGARSEVGGVRGVTLECCERRQWEVRGAALGLVYPPRPEPTPLESEP